MDYIELDGWRTKRGDISLKSAKKQGKGNIFEYQREEIDAAISRAVHFGTAIDVGAHLGILSVYMAQFFDRVYAFEIDHTLYPHLVHNSYKKCVEIDQPKKIITKNVGLGEVKQTVGLYTSNKSFGNFVKEGSGYHIEKLDNQNIQGRVGLIKLDTEGYEPLVIRGGINLILRDKPVILYERKGHAARYGYTNDGVLDELYDYGYRLHSWIGKRNKNAIIAHPSC